MTLVMYDSINPEEFAGLPMDAAAGYVDGAWPTYSTLGEYVPSGTILVSITVFGNPADCVDQEPGNIEVDPAAAWCRQRIEEGHWRPIVYTSASNMDNMTGALARHNVGVNEVRLWSAHYTLSPHICAPNVCGYPKVDGTQWTDRAHGRNLDQSELINDFFLVTPSQPPIITPEYAGDDPPMIQLVFQDGKASVVVPYGYAQGNSYLRMACLETSAMRVEPVGKGPTWSGTLSRDNGMEGPQIPRDCRFLIIRRDSGSAPIAMCFT